MLNLVMPSGYHIPSNPVYDAYHGKPFLAWTVLTVEDTVKAGGRSHFPQIEIPESTGTSGSTNPNPESPEDDSSGSGNIFYNEIVEGINAYDYEGRLASTGELFPSVVTGWKDSSNAKAVDTSLAITQDTSVLVASEFGINIPLTATIIGTKVRVYRMGKTQVQEAIQLALIQAQQDLTGLSEHTVEISPGVWETTIVDDNTYIKPTFVTNSEIDISSGNLVLNATIEIENDPFQDRTLKFYLYIGTSFSVGEGPSDSSLLLYESMNASDGAEGETITEGESSYYIETNTITLSLALSAVASDGVTDFGYIWFILRPDGMPITRTSGLLIS